MSETSIGKWKKQFLAGGRSGREHGASAAKPTGVEARLAEEIDVDSRPERRCIARRRRSPQTNGAVKRYDGAIKIEAFWRDLAADGVEMTAMVDDFRGLFATSDRTRRSRAHARSSATSPTPRSRRPTTPTPQRADSSTRQ